MNNSIDCYCRHCRQKLKPSHTGPCPSCGKTGKDCRAVFSTKVGINASTIARVKRKDAKKWVIEMISRWRKSGDPRLPKGVHEERTINREKKTYDQVVKDVNTGNITHEEHVSLEDHNEKQE